MIRSLLQDARYALRTTRRAPGFALVAIATLALGIGANTAIFSVVNAVLLRPLPYAEPDRLVMVWQDMRAHGGPATEWTTPANHFDWKAETSVFESVTTFRGWNATLSGAGDAQALPGEQVTPEYFDALGVRPALGRVFRPEEGLPGAPRVVILSHAVWAQRFGSDPSALGRVLAINGEAHEIIGVMPAGFRPALIVDAGVWRPQQLNPANAPRAAVVFHTIGRLRPGVSVAQASAALSALARRLEAEHPRTNTGVGVNPVPLQEQQVGSARLPLLVLLAAVSAVLLIACVNVANLLLARGTSRAREIAVRMALGAGRARILRQLVTESLMLAAAGGVVGVLLGGWAVSILPAIAPAGTPRITEVSTDPTVLLFAIAVTALTGVLFGVVPAWQSSHAAVAPALKEAGRGQAGPGGRPARRMLIIAELALALMLLVASGLLLRTFVALQRSDLGFNPDRVLTGFVLPPPVTYGTRAQRLAFYDRLLERTAAIPGAQQAALSSIVPLGGDSDITFTIEGRPPAETDAQALVMWYRLVSSNYMEAMGIPLRAGRTFAPREASPSVVINETMARKYWPGKNPIGQRIRVESDGPWFTIVGIAGDVHVRGARGSTEPEAYVPYWLQPEPGTYVVLKTAGEPGALASALKQAVKEVDPSIAVAGIVDMRSAIADSVGESRFYALMVGLFAALALLLAAVGVYGVMSCIVAQRTAEIGVRLALGAAEAQIFGLVIGDTLRLTAIGLLAGGAGALAVGRTLQKLLFGVRGTDPLTFVATAVTLLGVAFVASYLPARRAMRIDPMEALRAE